MLSGSDLPIVFVLLVETIRNIFYYKVDNSGNLDGTWQLKFVSVLETNNKRRWRLDVGQCELSLEGWIGVCYMARTSGTDILGRGCSVCSDTEDGPVLVGPEHRGDVGRGGSGRLGGMKQWRASCLMLKLAPFPVGQGE